MGKKYPKEVAEFICENYYTLTAGEIVKELDNSFSFKVTSSSLRCWASKQGIQKNFQYSEEEKEWIKNNWTKYINNFDLTNDFNNRFNSNRTVDAIKKILKVVVPDSDFGHSGGCKVGEGSSVTAKPIGSETFKGGYWWVKINDDPLPKNYTTEDRYKNWRQKHRVIWERHNGEIPEGCKIIFLDGNRNNFSLDNLYCADTRALLYLMRNKMWYPENGCLTLSAIKWAELKVVLSGNKLRNLGG